MDFLIIKHSDITKMNMDEMRELKARWDKMNKIAVILSACYLAPIIFVAAHAATIILWHIITKALVQEFNISYVTNLLPIIISLCLILALVKMKATGIKGHIATIIIYVLIGLVAFFIEPLYEYFFLASLIPMVFIFRCILNYYIIIELRKMPGYPTFYYTVSSKFADEIYLKEEKKPAQPIEDYKPWNAFEDETVKDTEDKDDVHN